VTATPLRAALAGSNATGPSRPGTTVADRYEATINIAAINERL
jgi:hypothetical protein